MHPITRGRLGRYLEVDKEEACVTEDLNQAVRDAWDAIAPWWDERFGEGNAFQNQLIGPATERLLSLQPEEIVLDVACGNGAFARRLASLGARVVAVDFSQQFLELARKRTVENAERIEYRLLDATDEEQLKALGHQRFDGIVCTMAMMDMATIEPLARSLPKLLKNGGRFVFSVLHPCFNNSNSRLVVEEENHDGELVQVFSVKVSRYSRPWVERAAGMRGQPHAHLYINRPLNALFAPLFAAGLALDGLEEPTFERADSPGPLNWQQLHDLPPVLVARFRLH